MVENEYAKAIFELALEEKKVEKFEECFDAVTKTAEGEFLDILVSPFINKDKKKEMVAKVYNSLDETFRNFLNVLIDHNRFSAIKSIALEYQSLVLESKNVVLVELQSAVKLTATEVNKLKASLSAKYAGKTIQVKNVVNPELIGGVRIITDEEAIDASVKGTLNKLKESL